MQMYFSLLQSLYFTTIPENKINLYKVQNKIMEDEIMPRNHVQNIMKLESYAHVID
jgi:hypothetical protein